MDENGKLWGRMLSEKELLTYTSLGRNKARALGEAAGARICYGRRVMYDRKKIDAYIDQLAEES